AVGDCSKCSTKDRLSDTCGMRVVEEVGTAVLGRKQILTTRGEDARSDVREAFLQCRSAGRSDLRAPRALPCRLLRSVREASGIRVTAIPRTGKKRQVFSIRVRPTKSIHPIRHGHQFGVK